MSVLSEKAKKKREERVRELFDWLGATLGFKEKEDWYKLTQADIQQHLAPKLPPKSSPLLHKLPLHALQVMLHNALSLLNNLMLLALVVHCLKY